MNDKFCAGKRLRVDVVPELAMLQSFSSGRLSGRCLNEKPRPVCAGGVLNRVLFQSLRRIADDHHHTHETTAADGAVGSSFALSMEVVMGTLLVLCLTIFIQAQLYRGTMENFSAREN